MNASYRSLLPLSLLSCLGLMGCLGVSENIGSEAKEDKDPGTKGGGQEQDWREVHACDGTAPSDDISVLDAAMNGDTLVIEAGHGGGCRTHEYGLCYETPRAASEPVVVELRVLHDADNDSCEAFMTPTLEFDLSELKEEVLSVVGNREIAVQLEVEGVLVPYSLNGKPAATMSWAQIHAELDSMNYCMAVSECQPVYTGSCSSRWVNGNASGLEELEAAISARISADGEDLGCPAICQCGALSCTDGRCVTRQTNCEEIAGDEEAICL